MAATAVVRIENLDFMVLVASDVCIAVVGLFSGLTKASGGWQTLNVLLIKKRDETSELTGVAPR